MKSDPDCDERYSELSTMYAVSQGRKTRSPIYVFRELDSILAKGERGVFIIMYRYLGRIHTVVKIDLENYENSVKKAFRESVKEGILWFSVGLIHEIGLLPNDVERKAVGDIQEKAELLSIRLYGLFIISSTSNERIQLYGRENFEYNEDNSDPVIDSEEEMLL